MAYNYMMHKFYPTASSGNHQMMQYPTPCTSGSTCGNCYCASCGQYHYNPVWQTPAPPAATYNGPRNPPAPPTTNSRNTNVGKTKKPRNALGGKAGGLDSGDTVYRGRASELSHLAGTGGGYSKEYREHSPALNCCSSSSQPQVDCEAKCRRGKSQPRHLYAPCCHTDRLRAVMRQPLIGSHSGGENEVWYWQQQWEDDDATCDSTYDYPVEDTTESKDSQTSIVSSVEEKHEEEKEKEMKEGGEEEQDIEITELYINPSVARKRQAKLMKKKWSDEKGVQCQFDIPVDMCMCPRITCEYCYKELVCKCGRMRCCKCNKLKSVDNREVRMSKVCGCLKRCPCKVSSYNLRFHSSPMLISESNRGPNSSHTRPTTY